MLAANEFTVGRLVDAKPLSLVLPRTRYEATFLIGQVEQDPAAIFLSGDHIFRFMKCSEATRWAGLVVPNVGVEFDETSAFDPQFADAHFGSIVRSDTRLVILARPFNSLGVSVSLTLNHGLPQIQDLTAAFSRWRIVIGEGQEKRVLREIDTGQKREAQA